jgi:hypothetical protein
VNSAAYIRRGGVGETPNLIGFFDGDGESLIAIGSAVGWCLQSAKDPPSTPETKATASQAR